MLTEAEKIVARMDSYTQKQHEQGIAEARQRIQERLASRELRAARAAARLRGDMSL